MRRYKSCEALDAKQKIGMALAVASGIALAFDGKSNAYDEWLRALEQLDASKRGNSKMAFATLDALLPMVG